MGLITAVSVLCLVHASAALHLPSEPFRPAPKPRPAALPAAAARDVAAEAVAAASLLRRDVLPLTGAEQTVRPLVLMAIREESVYAQLVAELVQTVTTGNRAGTSWVRPLALRRAQNTTLAASAEKFDPVLGWLDTDVGGGSVHVFSAAGPAAFLPTAHTVEAPLALAIAVRSLAEAHAAAAADTEPLGPDGAVMQRDMGELQAFMQLVAQHATPTADENDSGGGEPGGASDLYDPLANL